MRQDHIEEVYAVLADAHTLANADVMRLGLAMHIAHVIGADRSSVHRGLLRLHDEQRAHIHSWMRTRGTAYAAIWVRGPGVNAERPGAMTRDEVNRLKRERRRAANNGELTPLGRKKLEDSRHMESRRKTDTTVERARAMPQTWFSSLEPA